MAVPDRPGKCGGSSSSGRRSVRPPRRASCPNTRRCSRPRQRCTWVVLIDRLLRAWEVAERTGFAAGTIVDWVPQPGTEGHGRQRHAASETPTPTLSAPVGGHVFAVGRAARRRVAAAASRPAARRPDRGTPGRRRSLSLSLRSRGLRGCRSCPRSTRQRALWSARRSRLSLRPGRRTRPVRCRPCGSTRRQCAPPD